MKKFSDLYCSIKYSIRYYLMNVDFLYFLLYFTYISSFIYDLLSSNRIFIFKDWYIPYNGYDHFRYVWDDELFGHISLFRSIDAIILLSNNILGLNVTQKISFLAIFILPYISFYILLRNNFGQGSLSSFLASVLYSLNPITLDLLWGGNGAISVAVIYGIIPIIYYLIIKIYRDYDVLYIFIFSVLVSFISYNLWQLALLLIPILLFHICISIKYIRLSNVSNAWPKIFMIILLVLMISLPNLFFNYSRTYILDDMMTTNDMAISNLKWGYQYVNFDNIFQLKFNPSNYFVYRNCYLLDNCGYGYFYMGILIFIFLGMVILTIIKRLNNKLIFAVIFSIISLLLILLVSYLIKNHQNGLTLFLSTIRNPDKLLMVYIFFISLSFSYVVNILIENFKLKKKESFIIIFIFLSSLSLSFLSTWDGFGGLTRYHFNDKQSNLELLTVSNEKDLPYILNYTNISNERILYLPYCSNSLFASGDQLKNQPFTPNILGIRQEGTHDGYNQKLINNLLYFYSSIAENKSDAINTYLTLLNTNYIVIKKNIYDKKLKVLTLGISRVPYICGSSEDFIIIFTNLNYVPIFENEYYIIFEKTEKSLPIIYGLSEYNGKDINFERIEGLYDTQNSSFYCNNCTVQSSESISNNYRLHMKFNLINVNNTTGQNSFSIYLFDNWEKFINVTFLENGGLKIGKSESGIYSYQKFEKTSPIIKEKYYDIEILKLDNYLEIKYQNETLEYIDSYVGQFPFITIRFENSEGYFSKPDITSIDIKNIDYDKIDPTRYLIHIGKNSNITDIIFSNNFDKNWIIHTSDKKIRSKNSFLGFNNFKIETDDDNKDIVLYYNIQEIFEKFKLLSMGTLTLFLIVIIKKRVKK